jgi:nucleoside-diphosphate-sugar epimerase
LGRKGSRALVTGGAGFIGSHIVDRLVHENYDVRVLDNFSTGSLENIAQHSREDVHLIKGDVRDLSKVKLVMKDVDVVFHQAALASPVLSTKDPRLTEDINVKGTLNLLEASAHIGVKRFIFASSAAVYGTTSYVKMNEEMTTRPTTPYGISKLAAECYVRLFNELYGIKTVSLRYFNVYGPRQRFDNNSFYSTVIPIFISRLSRELPPTVYGDGEQTRDFVYVEDIAQANMLALECNQVAGEVFNIGSGKRVTVNRVSRILKEFVNKEYLNNSYLSPRPTDVRHGYADISKAKKALGYRPRFSVREGLKKCLEWYQGKISLSDNSHGAEAGTE